LLGIGGIAQDVNHVRAAHALWIVDTGVFPGRIGLQLGHAFVGFKEHVLFAAEVQATGGAGLYASRLQARAYAVRTQRALIDLFGRGVEFGNVEGATGYAILAPDAVRLVEVHDAVAVLNDGAVSGTGFQTTRLFAMHALILAHQPLHVAVIPGVFVELDQVPEVPGCFRHRLVGVIESGLAELVSVPLHAGDLAGLAADASRRIDQLAHVVVTGDSAAFFAVRLGVGPAAGRAATVTGDRFDFQCAVAHGVSPLDLLDLHQKAFELWRVSVGINHRRRKQIGWHAFVFRTAVTQPLVSPVNGNADL